MATCAIRWDANQQTSGPNKVGEMQAAPTNIVINPDNMHNAEYYVYLHTISKRYFMQPNAVYGEVLVPACPKDKRYITFMSIPHPTYIPTADPNNPGGETIMKQEHGRRMALSVCDPAYMGNDLSVQDTAVSAATRLSSSNFNLTREGVFASMNKVPTEEELLKAEARREAYYHQCLDEADALQLSNPRMLQEILTQDHHMAAEYFGVEKPWHSINVAKIECPNCGEKIKQGIAFHYNNGHPCILDWENAWLAGAVKKEDIPEPRRWWQPDPPEPETEEGEAVTRRGQGRRG
jgi:hypothetical protein